MTKCGKIEIFHWLTEQTPWKVMNRGKWSKWPILEEEMQERKLMGLESFQLIPSPHFEVLFYYLTLRAINSLYI